MQRISGYAGFPLAVAAFCLAATAVRAHPVPRESHDRVIDVHLARQGDSNKILVTVFYRLEVDEWTVLEKDMPAFADEVPFARFGRNKLDDFYGEFTRIYAPILGRKLRADLDGKRLQFECIKRTHTLKDEQGRNLGHLRCDFEFRTSAPVTPSDTHQFHFRDGTYLTQSGKIDVSLAGWNGLQILKRVVPSAELKNRPVNFQAPGDDDRLREVSVTFTLPRAVAAAKMPPQQTPPRAQSRRARPSDEDHADLRDIFLRFIESGSWVFLLLAAWIGAVHALTPGHGKTLIAAYLVGENGTVWHALVLGLVTTFTHTGVVLVLALGLALLYPTGAPEGTRQTLQTGLELLMGLLVVCAGVWLLLRRLSGMADHFHFGGHGHHHHHGHHHGHDHSHSHAHGNADHDHDATGQVVPRKSPVGWRGLVVMGVSGGIVPCWDAIAILAFSVGKNMIWLALPLVLAFSAGLASVLVLLGILVVRTRGFASSRWGEGRLVRSLPIVSALVVTLLGFWLCYEAVHARPQESQAAARTVDSRP